MKILHIVGSPGHGGAEIFFSDAVKALNTKNIEQRVIHHKDNTAHAHEMRANSIPHKVASFNSKIKFTTQKTINAEINNFQPDIVHYWSARAALFAAKGNHINVGWYSSYKKAKHFKKCQYHLGVTDDVSQHILNQNIPRDNIYTLPIYTHDFDNIQAVPRHTLNTPDDKILLLSLARLHPVKGLDILLHAMQQLSNCHLWLAGDGPLEQELKSLSTALKINNRVSFLGWRNDKEALMMAADICVFPSRNDSFGAVMIESWASKTPFIATKAPGPKAYVTHKKDGMLVEIDNIAELVSAIEEIKSNENLRSHLIHNGFKNYKDNFSQKNFIKTAQNIYTEILEKKNSVNKRDVLDLKKTDLFATGGNRFCYIHPQNPDLCVKILKQDSIKKLRARRSFIKNLRPASWFDDNKNEYHAYQQSAVKKNEPEIYTHIPKCYGWINSNLGEGLVLDYFKQKFGAPCITLETYLKQNGYTPEIDKKLHQLAQYLRKTKLLTKNILPHNLIITEEGTLKIIDGLGISSPFNPANFLPFARDNYIERRIKRMFLRAQWESSNRQKPWTETEKQGYL